MTSTTEPGAPSIEELADQERRLVLPRAGLVELCAIGSRIADAARAERLPVTVQVRLGERLVYAAALPGSTANNDAWAERKARVTHLFERSSLLVRCMALRDGYDVEAKHRLPLDRYSAHGGAFPLRVDGVGFVGSIVVSGLPQVDDHGLVVRHLRRRTWPRPRPDLLRRAQHFALSEQPVLSGPHLFA